MTVGELKKLLDEADDNSVVMIVDPHDQSVLYVDTVAVEPWELPQSFVIYPM